MTPTSREIAERIVRQNTVAGADPTVRSWRDSLADDIEKALDARPVVAAAPLAIVPQRDAVIEAAAYERAAKACDQVAANAERRYAGYSSDDAKARDAALDKMEAAQLCADACRALKSHPAPPAQDERAWRPTHEHYKGGQYRVVARGRLKADLSPVVIYDNNAGETWVRPAADFDQTDPFVRFTPLLSTDHLPAKAEG